jgi:hypothetical protein
MLAGYFQGLGFLFLGNDYDAPVAHGGHPRYELHVVTTPGGQSGQVTGFMCAYFLTASSISNVSKTLLHLAQVTSIIVVTIPLSL